MSFLKQKILLLPILALMFLQASCASWNKETLAYMGAGLAVGAVGGAVSAPDGDKKAMHAALWGGLTSAAVGATLIALKDDEARIRERDIEIEKLRIELSEKDKFESTMSAGSVLDDELPEEIRKLIQPGQWKVHQIDHWKKKKRGQFVHEDRILEFKPPKVKITR